MWVEDVDDITVEYEQDGVLLVKQEDKRIISRGTWSTIVFLYRDWNRKTDDYGPLKMTLRKYRKLKGTYRQESKFNIGSADQARAIAEVLKEWSDRG
ncbi:MAG: hypothetical protein GXP54_13025 [Deltaproteobacteria bacterium]|nr:hypothetical protein [Deltaproteobacteria bacterium]